MSTTRKITTIVLIILTLALGVLAIVIGVRITQSQAPSDSGASDKPDTCTPSGNRCSDGPCNGDEIPSSLTCTGGKFCCVKTVTTPVCEPFSCYQGFICSTSGTKGTVPCGSSTGTQPPPPPSGGSCNSGWCTTQSECSAAGGSWGGASSFCNPASLGQCCGVGSAPAPAPTPAPTPVRKVCGGTCTSDSQCITQSPSGAPVACRNGTCQNLNCIGSTVSGSACTCSQIIGTTTTTGTTSLPNTAIFDNKTDAILLGVFSIIIGLILWESSMFDNLLLLFKGEIALSSKKRAYRKKVESIINNAINKK